jgi:hypothetical protein
LLKDRSAKAEKRWSNASLEERSTKRLLRLRIASLEAKAEKRWRDASPEIKSC